MRSTLILSLSGFAAASTHFASSVRGHQKNLLPLGPFADIPVTSFAAATCPGSQISCDDSCAEAGSTCCNNGDGSYCPDGYYCYDEGCCEDDEVCSGPPVGCTEGADMCGEYCVPEGGDCCDTLSGEYCPSGQTCNGDGTCALGGGSNNGDDDSDDDSSSCDTDQESCGSSGCMPKGAECCGGIGYYCNAGDTCENDGTCSSGNSSNDDDDDSDSDDSDVTSSPTYTLTPIPTSIGDDDNGNDDSSSDSDNSDSSSDDSNDNSDDSSGSRGKGGKGGKGGSGDDDDSAAAIFSPKVVIGLIAMLPALL